MIDISLDREKAIVRMRPLGPLSEEDFARLAAEVDLFIEEQGQLKGVLLEISRFPGWENFGAALKHFRFIREHHRRVRKVAVVTDAFVGELAEHVAAHFVAADVRHFAAGESAAAERWLTE